MDVHVPYGITVGLRLRDVDVLTAQEDGSRKLDDADLITRATSLGRVVFSQDDDMLREGARLQRSGIHFSGIADAHQLGITIGQCIDDLELIAKGSHADEWTNRLEYLPLK